MRPIYLLVSICLAAVLIVAGASIAHKLSLGDAHRTAEVVAAKRCGKVKGCHTYGVKKCRRRSAHRVRCVPFYKQRSFTCKRRGLYGYTRKHSRRVKLIRHTQWECRR